MFGFNISICHLFIFSFLFYIFPLNSILYFTYPIIFSFLYDFIKFRFQSDAIKNDNVMTPMCNFEHFIDYDEIEKENEEIDPSVEFIRLVEEEEKEIQPHEEFD